MWRRHHQKHGKLFVGGRSTSPTRQRILGINFRRRNGRQMVLTCGGEERPAKPDRQVNSALVSAVAKTYRWQEQLESGQYASLEEY